MTLPLEESPWSKPCDEKQQEASKSPKLGKQGPQSYNCKKMNSVAFLKYGCEVLTLFSLKSGVKFSSHYKKFYNCFDLLNSVERMLCHKKPWALPCYKNTCPWRPGQYIRNAFTMRPGNCEGPVIVTPVDRFNWVCFSNIPVQEPDTRIKKTQKLILEPYLF